MLHKDETITQDVRLTFLFLFLQGLTVSTVTGITYTVGLRPKSLYGTELKLMHTHCSGAGCDYFQPLLMSSAISQEHIPAPGMDKVRPWSGLARGIANPISIHPWSHKPAFIVHRNLYERDWKHGISASTPRARPSFSKASYRHKIQVRRRTSPCDFEHFELFVVSFNFNQ